MFGQGHPGPAAISALAIVAILSGGLHLDGLADTSDALAAPAGAADRARTDPRAGTAGVVWAAPTIQGLSIRPDFAAAASGPCSGARVFNVPLPTDTTPDNFTSGAGRV